jgi:hypothetical protein
LQVRVTRFGMRKSSTDMSSGPQKDNRREFLKKTGLAAAAVGAGRFSAAERGVGSNPKAPWYRRTLRWGQTNITEIDPARYDVGWWRGQWNRTGTQGVIVNAGGIVAYYPTRVPLHQPAAQLGGRDLFGELCHAAHEDGLAVLARMDSNRAQEACYHAHPDWFAVDAEGTPYRAGDLFVTCVNGPYYQEHIPAILREIAERYRPEGFTDNSWSGLGRASFCHCENCRNKFKQRCGKDIPSKKDWNDPVYREWIRWNYDRRLELWDLNNTVTKAAGGADCIWSGMTSGSISSQSQSFRDYKAIAERAEIIMLDHQARSNESGFQNNGETGKLIHGLVGWNKLVPESMAMYQAGRPTFRLTSKPPNEARLWMLDGIAGGLQPWWHHVGAFHQDRRMYHTAEPVYRWHQQHEPWLVNREPVATVGVVWSQQNNDFYGRDDADLFVESPWRGMTQALIRARIPYLPVHVDHIARDGAKFATLVLPNVGALSELQLTNIRQFVMGGGGLLATGETSRFDEWGDPRSDYGLARLFGAHLKRSDTSLDLAHRRKSAADTVHSYLRMSSQNQGRAGEPGAAHVRHEVLRGFNETDILPFGGVLEALDVEPGTQVLLTFIPPFPIYPPETSWMRVPKTDIPGLLLNTTPRGSRVAFLPADIDRRFAADNLPDHGDLLANLVRWTARDQMPLTVKGPGLVDCHMYQQPGRIILHLVNLTNAGTWRQPVDELISVGPFDLSLKLPQSVQRRHAQLLVSGGSVKVVSHGPLVHIRLNSILDHEVLVIGG